MDSSVAIPMPAATKPSGLKGVPPGSRLPGVATPSPSKVAAPPSSAQPDSTPFEALPPNKKVVAAPVSVSGAVVRKASWPDYTLAIIALLTGIAAVVRLLMILGGD